MEIPTINETMSPQVFYILLALTDKTLHGYGIRDQVAHDSRGTVVMATGTVYILLKRLVLKGWIAGVAAVDRPKVTSRYELTALGWRNLEVEVRRIQEVAEIARYKMTGRIKLRH